MLVTTVRDIPVTALLANCVYDWTCATPAALDPVRVEVTGRALDLAINYMQISNQFSKPDPYLRVEFDEGSIAYTHTSRVLVDQYYYSAGSDPAAYRALYIMTNDARRQPQFELKLMDFYRTSSDDRYKIGYQGEERAIMFSDGKTLFLWGDKKVEIPVSLTGTTFETPGHKTFGLPAVKAHIKGTLTELRLAPLQR